MRGARREDRGEAWSQAWARWVLSHRVECLIVVGIATVVLGAGAARVRTDITAEGLLGTQSESMAVLADLKDTFGDDKLFQIVVQGDVFTASFFDQLERLHAALEDMQLTSGTGVEGERVVEELVSLVSVKQPYGRDGSLRVSSLRERFEGHGGLAAMREHVLADSSLVGSVVDGRGQHAVLSLFTEPMDEARAGLVYDAVQRAVAPFDREGFRVRIGGVHTMEALMKRSVEADMGAMFGLSLLVMCAVLVCLFRSALGVVGPVAVVLVAIVWTVGAMGWADVPFTGVTSVLTSLLLVVGVGDAIHIQSSYRDALQDAPDRSTAVVRALGHSGVPVLLTSLTTAAGLLSFRAAEIGSVQDMGTFGAIGVLAALLSTMVLLPILLSAHREGTFGGRGVQGQDALDRCLSLCDRASGGPPASTAGRRRRVTIGLAVLVGAASLAGLVRVRPYFDPLDTFPETHPARVAMEYIDRHVGGMGSVALLIEAPDHEHLARAELLRRLARLQGYIEAYRPAGSGAPIVTHVASILDPLRDVHQALFDGDPTYHRLPDTDGGVKDLLTAIRSGSRSALSRIWTVDDRRAVMTVRVRWQEAGAYIPFAAYIQRGVREVMGGAARVRVTGSVFGAAEVVTALVEDLARSFGAALVMISLLMIAMLRDLRLAIVAMLPNLLPILATAGLMGFAGINLNINTVLVASIALGIAVDDTIHLLYQYQRGRRAGESVEGAIRYAFHHSGRAMVGTSAVLGAGFVVFQVAEMTNVREFGVLVGAAIVFALLFDLVLTPALLRSVLRAKAIADAGASRWRHQDAAGV